MPTAGTPAMLPTCQRCRRANCPLWSSTPATPRTGSTPRIPSLRFEKTTNGTRVGKNPSQTSIRHHANTIPMIQLYRRNPGRYLRVHIDWKMIKEIIAESTETTGLKVDPYLPMPWFLWPGFNNFVWLTRITATRSLPLSRTFLNSLAESDVKSNLEGGKIHGSTLSQN
jgi:hypothetical protein